MGEKILVTFSVTPLIKPSIVCISLFKSVHSGIRQLIIYRKVFKILEPKRLPVTSYYQFCPLSPYKIFLTSFLMKTPTILEMDIMSSAVHHHINSCKQQTEHPVPRNSNQSLSIPSQSIIQPGKAVDGAVFGFICRIC